MKKMNKKGFTLAELLIVVAIIAVLVAIAIPVFTAQLEKSRIATDEANVRSWYGERVAAYLSDDVAIGNYSASLLAKGAKVTVTGGFSQTSGVTVTYSATNLDEDFVIKG